MSASYDKSVILWRFDVDRLKDESDEDVRVGGGDGASEGKDTMKVSLTKIRQLSGLHATHIFDLKADLTMIAT